jgi:hypothetical protein
MGFFDDLIVLKLQQQLKIPKKDLASVAADTGQYTDDGIPLTEAQLRAANAAIITYTIGRIKKGK